MHKLRMVVLILTLVMVNLHGINLAYAKSINKSTINKSHKHKKSKKSRVREKPHSADYMDGIASCYAKKFVGRKTTTGERFVMDKFTGAHPLLPMHTKLKITNLRNNRSVYIDVNDHMPKKSGHVVDLPWLSAHYLGMHCPDLAHVHLQVIDENSYNNIMRARLGGALIGSVSLLSTQDMLRIASQFIQESGESTLFDQEYTNESTSQFNNKESDIWESNHN